MLEKNGLQVHVDDDNACRSDALGRRTYLEKCLLFVVTLLIIVIIVIATLLALSAMPANTEICLTKECAEVAARIVQAIDYTVNPCDNFYNFACGSWMKQYVVPDDRSNLYTYGILRDKVRVTVKYLIEGNGDEEIEAVRKARQFYQSCMNDTRIEALNTTMMTDLLEELGGWPTLGSKSGGNWNENTFSLMTDLVRIKRYGASPFIKLFVGIDEKDTGKKLIHIDEPMFGLRSKPYFFDEEHQILRTAYLEYMTKIAILLGADRETARDDAGNIFNLDKELANLSLSNVERRNKVELYKQISISAIQELFVTPSNGSLKFAWLEFFQQMINIADNTTKLASEEEIVVETPRYFTNLFNVLARYDNRTIKNYMMWSVIASMVGTLPKRFDEASSEFIKLQYGTNEHQSRWKTCSQVTMIHFGMAIGRLFVKEKFDEEAKENALLLIKDLIEAFHDRLEELYWMDQETKKDAKDKATHINTKIGYPDFILNDTALNEYFACFQVVPDSYFANTVNLIKLYSRRSLDKLREPYKKDNARWEMHPAVVNAYYTPFVNAIAFPAGMLQPPYYSKYQPRSMNYGSIGFLIGHEITHAFDDIGRKYDKEGNIRQWWSQEAITRFNDAAKCFVDQYSQYVLPLAQLPIDGNFTKGENIADNGGLQQSYKAYQIWKNRHRIIEPKLPGVDFDSNQLFFISFAQGWCGVTTKQYEVDQVYTDSHSPGRFRIIGSLQNSEEFSQVFKCPVGSYMNPQKKCHVW